MKQVGLRSCIIVLLVKEESFEGDVGGTALLDRGIFTRSHGLPQSAGVIYRLPGGLKRSPYLSGPFFDRVLLVDWSLSGSHPFWRIHRIVNYYWPVYSTINKTSWYSL